MEITFKEINFLIDKLIPKSALFNMPCASAVVDIKSIINQHYFEDFFIIIKKNTFKIQHKNNKSISLSDLENLIKKPLVEKYFLSEKVQKILIKRKKLFLSQNKDIDKNSLILIKGIKIP